MAKEILGDLLQNRRTLGLAKISSGGEFPPEFRHMLHAVRHASLEIRVDIIHALYAGIDDPGQAHRTGFSRGKEDQIVALARVVCRIGTALFPNPILIPVKQIHFGMQVTAKVGTVLAVAASLDHLSRLAIHQTGSDPTRAGFQADDGILDNNQAKSIVPITAIGYISFYTSLDCSDGLLQTRLLSCQIS
jgi:hypothetical protein